MIDKTNYENIKTKKNLLSQKYKELNDLQYEIYLLKENIKKECNHDLLLVYSISFDYENDYEEYRNAYCLMCDNTIKLIYNNYVGYLSNIDEYIGYATKEKISNENIIDVTKFIPEEHRNYWISGQNELVLEAKSVIEEMLINNPDINNEELKRVIKNRLISFYKERENSLKKVYKKDY